MKPSHWTNVLDALLDLFFPPKCPFCGKILEKKRDWLCLGCQGDLPWLVGAVGERPVEWTEGCVSPLRYEDKVRDAILAYKFGGKSARGEALGVLVAKWVEDYGLDMELVSWPPLSKEHLRQRGYDQAKILADTVGKRLHLPVVRTLQKRNIPSQASLHEAAERKANVRGAYSVLMPENFAGKKLLLVDDVVTTGSTLSECAKTLKEAGVKEVVCATLARAR